MKLLELMSSTRLNSLTLATHSAGRLATRGEEERSQLNSTQLEEISTQLGSTREEISPRGAITRELEPAGPHVLLEVLRGASSRGDLEVIGGGAREIKMGPASRLITK